MGQYDDALTAYKRLLSGFPALYTFLPQDLRTCTRTVVMSPFVTPPVLVRAAHIFRPLVTPVGSIWCVDVSLLDGWPDIASNGPIAGLWRFVAVSAPRMYDGKGKAKILADELGRGSMIRVAGNQLAGGRRTVLTMKAVSVVDLVEPESVFSQEFV